MLSAMIASTRSDRASCQRARARVVARQRGDELDHRGAIAPDAAGRCAACRHSPAPRRAAHRPRAGRRRAASTGATGRWATGPAAASSQVGDRLAGREAGRLGRSPPRSAPHRPPPRAAPGPASGRGWPPAPGPATAVASRAPALMALISISQVARGRLDLLGRGRAGARGPEARLGVVLGLADRPGIGGKRGRSARVLCSS